jgi:hypothetical protein
MRTFWRIGLLKLVLSSHEEGLALRCMVAANDQMAFGAIRALKANPSHVPSQVSVTGFDDIPYSMLSVPALTTIHQPTRELGRRAIEYLAESLLLSNADRQHAFSDLSSAFVIRQSCGCISEDVQENWDRGKLPPAASEGLVLPASRRACTLKYFFGGLRRPWFAHFLLMKFFPNLPRP